MYVCVCVRACGPFLALSRIVRELPYSNKSYSHRREKEKDNEIAIERHLLEYPTALDICGDLQL